ncbi:uncharacterized protein A4U43_C08F32800 [Asparagus officinalis]|nr:uncharacterized protein A4U43_C08F32800 [Asparagus officinalis]
MLWTSPPGPCQFISGSHHLGKLTVRDEVGSGTILCHAHGRSVRSTACSHNDNFLITGCDDDFARKNSVAAGPYRAETAVVGRIESVRDPSFRPTDLKFLLLLRRHNRYPGVGGTSGALTGAPTDSLSVSGAGGRDDVVKLWDTRVS